MSWWQWLINGGVALVVLIGLGKWLGKTADKIIDKMFPLAERYVGSTEKLHVTLKDNMASQQALCQVHSQAIVGHDQQMRKAALEACAMCRAIAEKELPNSAVLVGKHCDEIERIIREA